MCQRVEDRKLLVIGQVKNKVRLGASQPNGLTRDISGYVWSTHERMVKHFLTNDLNCLALEK